MSFKMKYPIKEDLLPKGTKRRGGTRNLGVKFVVDHDTGNPNSTAQGNVNYYRNSANTMSASAQVFIDDKEIIVCIPLYEKAWHVLYNITLDNRLYGDDANDIAVGVELCYFPNDKARSMKAYDKYVWYNAYLAYTYKLNIAKDFIGHSKLDPGRKTDPENAFRYIGKTFPQFLADVQKEYNECIGKSQPAQAAVKDKGYLIESDKGVAVGALQRNLNRLGAKIAVDNIFGDATKKAVITFQKKYKLEPDGVFGKASEKVMAQELFKLDQPKPTPTLKPVVKPKPTVSKPVEPKIEEEEKLELAKWQREELKLIFKKAREKGIFTSDEHEKTIMDGTMTMSYLIYLQSVISGAALNDGKRIK